MSNNVRELRLENICNDDNDILVKHYPMDDVITIKQTLDDESNSIAIPIQEFFAIYEFVKNKIA